MARWVQTVTCLRDNDPQCPEPVRITRALPLDLDLLPHTMSPSLQIQTTNRTDEATGKEGHQASEDVQRIHSVVEEEGKGGRSVKRGGEVGGGKVELEDEVRRLLDQ